MIYGTCESLEKVILYLNTCITYGKTNTKVCGWGMDISRP